MFVVDAHNDLLLDLTHQRGTTNPFGQHWLGNLRAGGVRVQVCAIYAGVEHLPEAGLRRALEQVSAALRAVAENEDDVALIRTKSDLAALEHNDRVGLLLAMEGAEPFGYDPAMADLFWELGVRMFGLTWNRRNAFADGAGEPAHGGLSGLGRDLVKRLGGLGAIIDLAHASEGTFDDVLELSDRPGQVLVSHAGCREILDHPRNLTDDQMRALAEAEGVLGILALPFAIDPADTSIGRVVDHISHAVSIMGPDRVGMGGDFIKQIVRSGALGQLTDAMMPDGMPLDATIDGLEGPEDYGVLAAALAERAIPQADRDGILGQNLMAFLSRALPAC